MAKTSYQNRQDFNIWHRQWNSFTFHNHVYYKWILSDIAQLINLSAQSIWETLRHFFTQIPAYQQQLKKITNTYGTHTGSQTLSTCTLRSSLLLFCEFEKSQLDNTYGATSFIMQTVTQRAEYNRKEFSLFFKIFLLDLAQNLNHTPFLNNIRQI